MRKTLTGNFASQSCSHKHQTFLESPFGRSVLLIKIHKDKWNFCNEFFWPFNGSNFRPMWKPFAWQTLGFYGALGASCTAETWPFHSHPLGQEKNCKLSCQWLSVALTQEPYSVSREICTNVTASFVAITSSRCLVKQSGSISSNGTWMKINAQDTIYSTAAAALNSLRAKTFRMCRLCLTSHLFISFVK